MRDKLSQELASSTIRDALGRGNPTEGLIHHSDRGLQYASCHGSRQIKHIALPYLQNMRIHSGEFEVTL